MKIDRIIHPIAIAVFIVISATAVLSATSGRNPSRIVDPLDAAYISETIDYEKYLLERLFRHFAPERSDPLYAAPESSRPVKCLSGLLREARENRHRLTPAAQNFVSAVTTRPDTGGAGQLGKGAKGAYARPTGLDSTYDSSHFRVHYTTTGGSAPSLTDSDFDGTPDYVENAANYAETSYTTIISNLGYSNNYDGATGGGTNLYDIYIENSGAYGYTAPDDDTPEPTSTAWFSVDNSMTSSILSVTVAHEFYHVIQFGIDGVDAQMWDESTSTWMEDVVFDDVNDYVNYLEDFFYAGDQTFYEVNPDGQRVPLESVEYQREYASVVWPMFLAHKYGNNVIKSIWQQCATSNEKNFITATNAVLTTSYSSTFQKAMNEFAVYVYCTSMGDTEYPETDPLMHRPVTTMPNYEFPDRSSAWDDHTKVWTYGVTSIGAGTELVGIGYDDGNLLKRGRTFVRIMPNAFPYTSEYVEMEFIVKNPTGISGNWNVQFLSMNESGYVQNYGTYEIACATGSQSTKTFILGNNGWDEMNPALWDIFIVVTQPTVDDDLQQMYWNYPDRYEFDIDFSLPSAAISYAASSQASGDVLAGTFQTSGSITTAYDLNVTSTMKLKFTGNTTWSGEDIVAQPGGQLEMPASYTLTLNRRLELASGTTVNGLDGYVTVNSGGRIKLGANSTFEINDNNSRYITLGTSGIIEGASKTSSTIEGGRIVVTGNSTSITSVAMEFSDSYGSGYANLTYTDVTSGTLSNCMIDAGGGESHDCVKLDDADITIRNTEFKNGENAIYAYDNSDPNIHEGYDYDCPTSVNNVFHTTCSRALYAYLSSEIHGGRENDYEGGGNNFLKSNGSSGVHLYASNTGLQELEWNYWNGGADVSLAGGATASTSPTCSQFYKPARNSDMAGGIGMDVESALMPLAERDTANAITNLSNLLSDQTDAVGALIVLDYLTDLVAPDNRENTTRLYAGDNFRDAIRQAAIWVTARTNRRSGNYAVAANAYSIVRGFTTESLLNVESLFEEAEVRLEYLDEPNEATTLYRAFLESATADNPNRRYAEAKLRRLGVALEPKETALIPENAFLLSAEPNPFNPSTSVRYRVEAVGAVRVGIYNVSGQLIRALVNETREPGMHTIVWDGNDASGRPVASGVYLVRLTTPTRSITHRVTMVR